MQILDGDANEFREAGIGVLNPVRVAGLDSIL